MSRFLLVLMLLALAACQPQPESREHETTQNAAAEFIDSEPTEPTAVDYDVLDSEFEPLRSDFNHASGGLRLVFLVGPTCGICLRGMAELQESLNAELSDSRLQTFVVHLPVLGAEESDVLPAAQLLAHGNVHHYWDPEGRLGLRYTETFATNVYAWDMWFVYEPGTSWAADTPPPMPDFWMHQLRTLPDEKYLDAEVFAQAVRTRLQTIGSLDSQTGPEVSIVGVRIEEVMQACALGLTQ